MATAPIRVLVTSDIASEGVNLHKQCHHPIHFDLPWSLITLEQRNGRIDRYLQVHSPEIRYLVYNPADPTIASDVRILSKLIEKENAAHKALGDAASIMGLYSERAEEDAIRDVLMRRAESDAEQALESAAPTDKPFDPWAFAGLDSADSVAAPRQTVAARPVASLFDSADADAVMRSPQPRRCAKHRPHPVACGRLRRQARLSASHAALCHAPGRRQRTLQVGRRCKHRQDRRRHSPGSVPGPAADRLGQRGGRVPVTTFTNSLTDNIDSTLRSFCSRA